MAVNKVTYGGNTLIDLTSDSVTPETLASGVTAHDKSGNIINGLATRISVTQEAGQSESLVMSQKAVTDLVNDALGENSGTSYETVDSVEDMTDTSKSYVLSTTGTIWTYGEKSVFVENNEYNPSTASFNKRINSSKAEVTLDGCFLTDYIEVEYATLYTITLKGRASLEIVYSSLLVADYYDSNKTHIAQEVHTAMASDIGNQPNGTVITLPRSFNLFEASGLENTKYVRLRVGVKYNTAISAADCEGLIINLEPKNEYKTIAEWVDTGLAPSTGGSSGGNYVDLLVKVNQNKTDIAGVSNRVTALETESDSLTVPTFWQSAVDACVSKIKALQVGRNCVTFPFFSDNHQRNGYTGILIAHIMKECNIPYCFFGGDSISNGYIESEAVMIEQDKAFDTIMSYIPNGRFCRAVGNHDGFWNVSSATGDEYHYTDAQIYELFLREESIAQNKHFGGDGTYYYVDDIASKVRWVVLDTNDSTVEAEQISWLQNTALTFNESGWAVVFISHQPISNHYHALISNSAEVRTVVKNYINGSSANKADVVGWFSGHIHRDRIYTGIATNTTDDSQGTAMGFTQITITSDHTGIAYDDATKHTVANDDKSHAIDFVTINKATRKVNITRLGIGNDRSYTY
jgi:hypothetical protein